MPTDRDLDDLAAILDRPLHGDPPDPAPVPAGWRDHVAAPVRPPEPPVRGPGLVALHGSGVTGLAACAVAARLAGWL